MKTDCRRKVELHTFNEVKAEVATLLSGGYIKHGNWSLGQICRHLCLDLKSSMDGYPFWMYLFAPLRPFVRWYLLPRLLRFESPSAIPTMKRFVPPKDVLDESEVQGYFQQIERFAGHSDRFCKHPGFGFSDRKKLETIFSAHASHHLSFLAPTPNEHEQG